MVDTNLTSNFNKLQKLEEKLNKKIDGCTYPNQTLNTQPVYLPNESSEGILNKLKEKTDAKLSYGLLNRLNFDRSNLNHSDELVINNFVIDKQDEPKSFLIPRYEEENTYKNYPHLIKYKNNSEKELRKLCDRQRYILMIIDTLCSLINISVHFSYVRENYMIGDDGNNTNWICLFLSFGVCLMIIIRIFIYVNLENLKYLLSIRKDILKKKMKIKTLVLEMLLHLIQPYPYNSTNWTMMTVGKNIHYSASAILFSFCILRLYVCFKVIKYWNFYSDNKTKRIFQFFKNKSLNVFLYKANIKARGFSSLTFIFIVIVYLFSLIFKIYEDYEPLEKKNDFSELTNSFWFLIGTITTIGYGDFVPKSMVGRIIGIFCCMIGIFFLSLFVVALMNCTLLDSDEEVAYKKIDLLYTQSLSNNYITKYFNTYISHKMWRIKKKKEITDYFIKKNRYKINKEAHLLKIKASLEKPFDINEFCMNVKDNWDDVANQNKFDLNNNTDNLSNSIQPLVYAAQDSLNHSKTSKKYSFKLFNLSKLMYNIGSKFEIQNINEIKGDGIISPKKVNQSLREFHVRYKLRKVTNSKIKCPHKRPPIKRIESIDLPSESSGNTSSEYDKSSNLYKSVLSFDRGDNDESEIYS